MRAVLRITMIIIAVTGSTGGPARAQAVAPAASPSAPTFPVIGRSRSKRYCALETDRTNGAITVALLNDKIIAAGIGKLRAANLDKPELTLIEREKTMRDLRAVASALQGNARAGDAQVADLRMLATREPDANRSPRLRQLAETMSDTFDQQRSVGSDLAKLLTIVDGRLAGAQGGLTASGVMPETRTEHVRNGLESIDQRAASGPLNAVFNDVADDFTDRTIAIGKSEDSAAGLAPGSVEGC